MTDSQLEMKRQDERKAREKAVALAKASVAKASKALIKVELVLAETRRRQTKRDDAVAVGPEVRTDWVARYMEAMQLPESTDEAVMLKSLELHNTYADFLACARQGAVSIVSDLMKPVAEKCLKPCSEGKTDMDVPGVVRYKYVYHNIYFKVCTDDHGIYNGSDENAAKGAGLEVSRPVGPLFVVVPTFCWLLFVFLF